MKQIFSYVTAFTLFGCATMPPPRDDVFVHPESYVDKSVTICGYRLDGANIAEGRSFRDRRLDGGLVIVESGPLEPLRRGRVCVQGVISYVGCGPESLCLDAAFDYGIKIRKVVD